MKQPIRRGLDEVAVCCGIPSEVIISFIELEWVEPIDMEHYIFDEEDVARINLIHELQEQMGVNAEAVPIILHLIDQLNLIQSRLR